MAMNTWALFALAIFVASISPGPNVLMVVVNAAKFGPKGAIWTILGNLFCLFGVALLAAFGVGALISTAPIAYAFMKVAGGMYLVWLGVKILRQTVLPMAQVTWHKNDASNESASRWALFGQAVAVSASNPKSILFLTAIFPQFLDSSHSIIPQFVVMFLTIILLVTAIHGGYGWMATRIRARPMNPKFRRAMSAVTGTTFVGLGASIALGR